MFEKFAYVQLMSDLIQGAAKGLVIAFLGATFLRWTNDTRLKLSLSNGFALVDHGCINDGNQQA
jgi:hypothetical protein